MPPETNLNLQMKEPRMMPTNRPNILLFLTDDHGQWATGCYGNSEVRSPTMDRLAAEGVRFANAVTPCPVCSPARACLLTGRTPSQVGIHDWLQEAHPEIGDHDWLAEELTLPEILSASGYHCGLSGKWHLGQSHQKPRGFDWHFGLLRSQGSHIEKHTYTYNNEPCELTGNKTKFITDYALKFLDTTPDDQPFFLNVGYISTHSPYANQDPDLEASYETASFADIPEYIPHPWHKNEGLVAGRSERSELRTHYQSYYAAVTDMDRNIERLLTRLEEQGKLDNTLVIYTSDHGCALGHHGFWGKGNSTRPLNMYETSLRIPLIMRWPGHLAAGKVAEQAVDHYDTFMAIRAAAGIETQPEDESRNYPGKNYLPLIETAAANEKSAAAWDDTRYGEYGDLRMIRTADYKFVKRYPHGPHDLFDLKNDPAETVNLSGQESHAAIQAQLEAQLEEFYAQHESPEKTGLRVKELRRHNDHEAWRDGLREASKALGRI